MLIRHGKQILRQFSSLHSTSLAALVDGVEQNNVRVQGWASSVQKRGPLVFVKLIDGLSPSQIQLVVPRDIAEKLQVGSALSATGIWQNSAGAQQNMELLAERVDIVASDVDPRYDTLSPDNLRKNVHLRARSTSFAAFLRARSRIFHETHRFFESLEFVHIDAPLFTANDCEGGGEVFTVQSEGENPLFLTVSSQLHLESMCSRLSRVYTLNTALRAEKQQSHAHLSEFRMLETEVAFCESVDEMCDFIEKYVRHIICFVRDNAIMQQELAQLGKFRESKDNVEKLSKSEKWPRIRYVEAVKLLESVGEKVSARSGFSKQNELRLVKEHGGPVFVTHYPAQQKPFYMKRDGDDSLSFDLLCPMVGELAGGSVREQNVAALQDRGCTIDWYLECRRRGQPPTSGFGIGFERLLQLVCGVRNIKDTTPFPRWHNHCQC